MSNRPSKNLTVGDFILNNEAAFAWTVKVFVPNENGDGKRALKFKVEFVHVTPEERMQMLEQFQEQLAEKARLQKLADEERTDEDVAALRAVLSFERMLMERVVNRFISGVRNASGEDISQLESTKAGMLSNAWARDALIQAYQQALQGRSAEGN